MFINGRGPMPCNQFDAFRVKRILAILFLVGLVAGLTVACGSAGDDDAAVGNADSASPPGSKIEGCPRGTAVSAPKHRGSYCIIPRKRGITEQGFVCPRELQFAAAYGNLDICGPSDELTPRVEEAAKKLVNENYIAGSECEETFCNRGKLCTEGGQCEAISRQRACIIGCEGGIQRQPEPKFCGTDEKLHTQCGLKCRDIERAEDAGLCEEGPGEGECALPTPSVDVTYGSPVETVSADSPIEIPPRSQVSVDVSADSAFEGVDYEWTLAEKPRGTPASLETTEPSTGSEAGEIGSANLYADLAGRYVLELKLSKNEDCTKNKNIVIDAVPQSDVFAQLFWKGPNQTCAANLDLHYLNTKGTWNQRPWDIFEGHPTADWGEDGARGDPILHVNGDNEGPGPEILTHSNLVSDGVYRLGVHYKDNEPRPGADGDQSCEDAELKTSATVQIYMNGVLIHEAGGQALDSIGQFWRVAELQWSIKDVGQVSEGFPTSD